MQDIELKKRSFSELNQLRSEFNATVRKEFLKDLGKEVEYLKDAGFNDVDILKYRMVMFQQDGRCIIRFH